MSYGREKNAFSCHSWGVYPKNQSMAMQRNVCNAGEGEVKYIVKEHNSQTGQKLDP